MPRNLEFSDHKKVAPFNTVSWIKVLWHHLRPQCYFSLGAINADRISLLCYVLWIIRGTLALRTEVVLLSVVYQPWNLPFKLRIRKNHCDFFGALESNIWNREIFMEPNLTDLCSERLIVVWVWTISPACKPGWLPISIFLTYMYSLQQKHCPVALNEKKYGCFFGHFFWNFACKYLLHI